VCVCVCVCVIVFVCVYDVNYDHGYHVCGVGIHTFMTIYLRESDESDTLNYKVNQNGESV